LSAAPFCGAATSLAKYSTGPSNFLLLNLYIAPVWRILQNFKNPSNFRDMLLPPKEPQVAALPKATVRT
jgi:hypothetical protein